MTFFGPADFKKYFLASLLLALICLIGAFLSIGSSGLGNVFSQEDIIAHDVVTFDTGYRSDTQSDRAIAKDANYVKYHSTTDWGVQPDGESGQTFVSEFTITGASGGYQNQYVVKVSSGGLKHTYSATKIKGDFTGSGNSVVIETGVPSLDSLILMEGNATFHGRIINGWTGRPVNTRETDLVANATIRSYLNASIPQKSTTESDWLAFCAQTYKDMIASGEPGFYIQPAGYDIDENGLLELNRSEWQQNATTKLFELNPGVI